jgi:hypothetical protein
VAQTIIEGLRDVETAQAQLIPEQVVQNKIDLLTANKTPWTLFTRSAKKKKAVGDNTFYIYQDLLVKAHTLLTAQVAVSATTWNVTTGTGAYIAGWDILWNRTRNVFVHVQSISTDAVTVVANYDSGTDTQGEIGDEILILGNATQEGGGVPQARTVQETKRTNYPQDIMTAFEFTDQATHSDSHFTQKDEAYQMMKFAIDHQRKIERVIKFNGLPALTDAGGTYEDPLRSGTYKVGYTMGFFGGFMNAYADSDHIQTEASLTENEFIDILPYVFFAEYEGQNKKQIALICGPSLLSGITRWNIGRGRFTMETSSKPKTLGLKFTKWDSPFGRIDIIVDHEMDSSVAGNENWAAFIDRSRMGYVPYQNLDTHIKRNVTRERATIKREIGYFRTFMGTHFTQENSHLWLKYSNVA